ncbi:hypothetical protein [Erwinia aphidicola]|uniref:Phage/conjugal plasmid C-4 type zinc finger TraR family protein n=1 Tax=Erwinia aphidicola TaxID=68334 RepID=A0ABU8DL63_ERWAP
MNFADPIDEAAAREQQLIEVALANRKTPDITFSGNCHYCEDEIEKGCFCSSECRSDYERALWAKKNRKLA